MGTVVATRSRRRATDEDADPRIARRRQEVEAGRARRRLRWLVAVASVATVGALVWALLHSPLADIDQLEVRGADHVDVDAVRTASGLRVGDPVLGLDGDAVAGMEALPWVRDASVTRDPLAGTVVLTVSERRPVAVMATDAGWVLIDAEGMAVAEVAERPAGEVGAGDGALTVPMAALSGVDVPELGTSAAGGLRGALDVLDALPPGIGSRVDGVEVDGDQLVLHLRPSGSVRFGRAEQIGPKIRSLQAVVAQVDLTDLCAVDLRVPASPVVDRSQPCA